MWQVSLRLVSRTRTSPTILPDLELSEEKKGEKKEKKLTSRSVAYASASERRANVYREDCATPSPLRANCAKRLQQPKQAVWAFGRIM